MPTPPAMREGSCRVCGGRGKSIKRRDPRPGVPGRAVIRGCLECGRAAGIVWTEIELVNCLCVLGTKDGPCPLHPEAAP